MMKEYIMERTALSEGARPKEKSQSQTQSAAAGLVDRIENSGTSVVFVQLMNERGDINPNDISKLIDALEHKTVALGGIAREVKNAFQLYMLKVHSIQPTVCSSQSVVPPQQARPPTPVTNEKKTQFVKELRDKYTKLCERVQPAPPLRVECDIANVFVQGEIKFLANRQEREDLENWIGLENYKLAFTDSRIKSKRRIIDGGPGYGKSTLALHMAHEWCQGVAPLKDFDILILLRLRQYKKVPTVYRAIKQFLLPKHSNLNEDDIKAILDSSSTLVVLDGYDEYPERECEDSDINHIIRGDMFQEHEVVVTTRTSCLPPKYAEDTTRLRLTGFCGTARETYIRKIVHCPNEADKISRFLKENPVLADLSRIPLFFAMIVYMAHRKERFYNLKTVTKFFDHIITCLYRHDQMKDLQVKGEQREETDHSKLSEIAFEGLSRESERLSWDRDELKNKLGETAYEEYIRIGILIEEENYNFDAMKYETGVTFYHQLFAEWFAAHSLVNNAATPVKTLDKILFKTIATNRPLRRLLERLNPRDLHYLYRFACGSNREVGLQIVKHLGENKDFDECTLMCIPELGGSLQTVLNTVRQLCTRCVKIRYEDSLLLQNSAVTLITFASSRKIPIARVGLSNCLSIDSTGNLSIQPSNLPLPVEGTSMSELWIYEYGRVMTEEETDSILQYAAKCWGLKTLRFVVCQLPQFVKKTDTLSVLRSREVEVEWLSPVGRWYLLSLYSGRWEDPKTCRLMTDEEYQKEVKEVRWMTKAETRSTVLSNRHFNTWNLTLTDILHVYRCLYFHPLVQLEEIRKMAEESEETFDRLKQDIVFLLQKDECLKLSKAFKFSELKRRAIENDEIPAKLFLLTLEEQNIIHPSDVSALQKALEEVDGNHSCKQKLALFQQNIPKVTPYDRFITELSSHINVSTAMGLCKRFNISGGRKDSIVSSQNPGLSLLLALDEKEVIKATDVQVLQSPLQVLDLLQASSKVQEYQSNAEEQVKNVLPPDVSTMKDKFTLLAECVKKKLVHWYEARTPIPWKKSCKWRSNDLFVGSGLIRRDLQSISSPTSVDKKCKLQYTDIISHKDLVSEKRMILEGEPGCGKTMLTAQLAYDWAQSKIQDVDMLIWLPLKLMGNKTVTETIEEFYIPCGTPLLEGDICKCLALEDKVIVVLLDGLEEYTCTDKENSEVMMIFLGKKHLNWKVVLTCRSDYSQSLPECPRLHVGLFGDEERDLYIQKVCKGDSEKATKLKDTIKENPLLLDVLNVPLLFVLVVHNIEAANEVKGSHFPGVGPIMGSMISTLIPEVKVRDETIGYTSEYSGSGTLHLGEIAFNGLCTGHQQLMWQRRFLESNLVNCREWINAGILINEEGSVITESRERTKQTQRTEQKSRDEVVNRTEDDSDVVEQKDSVEKYRYQEYTAKEKNEDQAWHVEESPIFETNYASSHKVSPKTTTTEENTSSSKTPVKDSKQNRNFTSKHVPQGVKFLHKVIQEWFAATYFSNMMEKCRSRLQYLNYIYQTLLLIDPIDLHYVLRFTCYMYPPFRHIVMNHLLQQYHSKNEKVSLCMMDFICLCFAEHNDNKDDKDDEGTDIMQVVSEICKEIIVVDSQDSRVLQQSKAALLEYASKSKITIDKVVLNDVIQNVEGIEIVLNSGAKMGVLDTLRRVEVISWNPALTEDDISNTVELLARSRQIMEIVCVVPLPRPRTLSEKTKHRIRESKLTLKWMIGSMSHTYDSSKDEWMDESRASSVKFHSERRLGAGKEEPLEATAVVSKYGCVLTIPRTGVALNIPPNAFQNDEEVTLKILPYQLLDESSFEEQSTVMVEIIPNKLILEKDAKLILPHCLKILNPETCQVQVLQSHHDAGTDPTWKEITHSVSPALRDSYCEIFIKSFCWITCKLKTGEKVKGKRIFVYVTGNRPKLNHSCVKIDVGYHPDLPGRDKMFQENKGECVVTQSFIFLKEPPNALGIDLTDVMPPKWTPTQNKDEIEYFDIANSNENRRSFMLTKDQSDSLPLSCNFKVSQGDRNVPLSIILEYNETRTVPTQSVRDRRCVTVGDLQKISKGLTSNDWKTVARHLDLKEGTIEHIDSNHPGNEQEKIYQMLITWTRTEGSGTSDVLENALRKGNRADLANMLGNSSSDLHL